MSEQIKRMTAVYKIVQTVCVECLEKIWILWFFFRSSWGSEFLVNFHDLSAINLLTSGHERNLLPLLNFIPSDGNWTDRPIHALGQPDHHLRVRAVKLGEQLNRWQHLQPQLRLRPHLRVALSTARAGWACAHEPCDLQPFWDTAIACSVKPLVLSPPPAPLEALIVWARIRKKRLHWFVFHLPERDVGKEGGGGGHLYWEDVGESLYWRRCTPT